MDLLREWLRPLILCELSALLELVHQSASGGKQKPADIDRDDDGRIRITINTEEWKFARALQLVRFRTYEEPIRAVVSDSQWSMPAEFCPAAVRAFESSHQEQRISENTLGGIFQVFSCRVVLRPGSSVTHGFFLLIDDCQYLGSGGSALHGNPRKIESDDKFNKVFKRLSQLLGQLVWPGSNILSCKHEHESAANSQADVYDSVSRGGFPKATAPLETQLSLSTQLPPTHAVNSESFEEPLAAAAANSNRNIQPQPTSNIERVPTALTDTNMVNQILLRLLSRDLAQSPSALKTRDPSVSMNVEEKTPANPSLPHTSLDNQKSLDSPSQASKPDSAQNREDNIKSCSLDRPVYKRQTETDIEDKSKAGTEPGNSREKSPGRTTTQGAQRVVKEPIIAVSARDEGSKVSVMPSTHQRDQISAIDSHENKKSRATSARIFAAWPDGNDPWKGMTRIRRRDVRIPKDQEILLRRSDCWIPPEPGSRGPITNIPVALLTALNKKAEHSIGKSGPYAIKADRRARATKSPAPHSNTESPHPRAEQDDDVDTDSLSVASSDWPESPIRTARVDQLPPDSSAPESEIDIRSAKDPTRKSLSNGDTVDNLAEYQQTKRRRTEKSESPQTNFRAVRQAKKDMSAEVRSAGSPNSYSDFRNDRAAQPESERQPGKDSPRTNGFSAQHSKTSESNLGFADTMSDQDESEMELCLPTALDDELRCRNPVSGGSVQLSQIPGSVPALPKLGHRISQSDRSSRDSISPPPRRLRLSQQRLNGTPDVYSSNQAEDNSSSVRKPSDTSPSLNTAYSRNGGSTFVHGGDLGRKQESSLIVGNVDRIMKAKLGYEGQDAGSEASGISPSNRVQLSGDCPTIGVKKAAQDSEDGTDLKGKRKSGLSDCETERPTKRRRRLEMNLLSDFKWEDRQVQDVSRLAHQQRTEFLQGQSSSGASGAMVKRNSSAIQYSTTKSSQVVHTKVDCSPTVKLERSISDFSAQSLGPEIHRRPNKDLARPSAKPPPPTDSHTYLQQANGQNSMQHPAVVPDSSTSGNVYGRFKQAYPSYTGTLKEFVMTCALIEWLVDEDRMEHWVLWDDFVLQYLMHYEPYHQQLRAQGSEVIPYEKFFKDHLHDFTCTSRILTPESLMDALRLDPPSAGEMRYGTLASSKRRTQIPRSKQIKTKTTPSTALPKVSLAKEPESSKPNSPPLPRSTLSATVSSHNNHKQSVSENRKPDQIDLTLTGDDSLQIKRATPLKRVEHPTKPGPARRSQGPVRAVIPAPRQISQDLSHLSPYEQTIAQLRLNHETCVPRTVPRRPRSGAPQRPDPSPKASTTASRTKPEDKITTIPSSSHANKRAKAHSAAKWWKDYNTPFKEFARAYVNLKSLQGQDGTVDQDTGGIIPVQRQMDILEWEL